MSMQEKLKTLIAEGLIFSECVEAFGVRHENPFAKAASEMYGGDDGVEVDSPTVLSESDEGAYVLAWVWVSNSDAGALSHSELLQEMLEIAQNSILEDGDAAHGVLHGYASCLEDVILNFSEKLDDILSETITGSETEIVWIYELNEYRFKASDAIKALNDEAKCNGLDDVLFENVNKFVAEHGKKLDVAFKAITLKIE